MPRKKSEEPLTSTTPPSPETEANIPSLKSFIAALGGRRKDKEEITRLWNGDGNEDESAHIKLQNWLTGQPVIFEVDGKPEPRIISLKESLWWFEKLANALSPATVILNALWTENTRLQNWLTGQPVKFEVDGGREVKRTIPLSESCDFFYIALASQNSYVIEDVWNKHPTLQDWILGRAVTFKIDGKEEPHTISLKECLKFFKQAFSSKDTRIVKVFVGHPILFGDKTALDDGQLADCFTKILKYALRSLPTAQSFFTALPETTKFTRVIKKLQKNLPPETTPDTPKRKTDRQGMCLQCYRGFRAEAASSSQANLDEEDPLEAEPPRKRAKKGTASTSTASAKISTSCPSSETKSNILPIQALIDALKKQKKQTVIELWHKHADLRDWLTGQPVIFQVDGKPEPRIISLKESLWWFETLTSAQHGAKLVLDPLWTKNTRLQNWLTAQPVPPQVDGDEAEGRTISLPESLYFFKRALISQSPKVINDFWGNHPTLQHCIIGKPITFLVAGKEKAYTINLDESLEFFKQAFTSHNSNIVKAFVNHSILFGKETALDYWQLKDCLTKILDYALRNLSIAQSFFMAFPVTEKFTRIINELQKNLPPETTDDTKKRKTDRQGMCLQCYRGYVVETASSSQANADADEWLEEEIPPSHDETSNHIPMDVDDSTTPSPMGTLQKPAEENLIAQAPNNNPTLGALSKDLDHLLGENTNLDGPSGDGDDESDDPLDEDADLADLFGEDDESDDPLDEDADLADLFGYGGDGEGSGEPFYQAPTDSDFGLFGLPFKAPDPLVLEPSEQDFLEQLATNIRHDLTLAPPPNEGAPLEPPSESSENQAAALVDFIDSLQKTTPNPELPPGTLEAIGKYTHSIQDELQLFSIYLKKNGQQTSWPDNPNIQALLFGQSIVLSDGSPYHLSFQEQYAWLQTILASQNPQLIQDLWTQNITLQNWLLGQPVVLPIDGSQEIEISTISFEESLTFFEQALGCRNHPIISQLVEENIVLKTWLTTTELPIGSDGISPEQLARVLYLYRTYNAFQASKNCAIDPQKVRNSIPELQLFDNALVQRDQEAAEALWIGNPVLQTYLTHKLIGVSGEETLYFISFNECVSFFNKALDSQIHSIIEALWIGNPVLQAWFSYQPIQLFGETQSRIISKATYIDFLKHVWNSGNPMLIQAFSLNEQILQVQVRDPSSTSNSRYKKNYKKRPKKLKLKKSKRLAQGSDSAIPQESVSTPIPFQYFVDALTSAKKKKDIEDLWNGNEPEDIEHIKLQYWLTGKPVIFQVDGKPEPRIISLEESLDWFKKVASAQNKAKVVLNALWTENTRLQNWLTGKPVKFPVDGGEDVERTIYLPENFAFFRAALGSQNADVINDFWEKHPPLQDWILGKAVTFKADGEEKEEPHIIPLEKCLDFFDRAFSSHDSNIVEAFVGHRLLFGAETALDDEQLTDCLTKILNYTSRNLPIAQSFFAAFPVTEQFTRVINMLRPAEPTTPTEKIKSDKPLKCLKCYKRFGAEAASSSQANLDEEGPPEEEIPRKRAKKAKRNTNKAKRWRALTNTVLGKVSPTPPSLETTSNIISLKLFIEAFSRGRRTDKQEIAGLWTDPAHTDLRDWLTGKPVIFQLNAKPEPRIISLEESLWWLDILLIAQHKAKVVLDALWSKNTRLQNWVTGKPVTVQVDGKEEPHTIPLEECLSFFLRTFLSGSSNIVKAFVHHPILFGEETALNDEQLTDCLTKILDHIPRGGTTIPIAFFSTFPVTEKFTRVIQQLQTTLGTTTEDPRVEKQQDCLQCYKGFLVEATSSSQATPYEEVPLEDGEPPRKRAKTGSTQTMSTLFYPASAYTNALPNAVESTSVSNPAITGEASDTAAPMDVDMTDSLIITPPPPV